MTATINPTMNFLLHCKSNLRIIPFCLTAQTKRFSIIFFYSGACWFFIRFFFFFSNSLCFWSHCIKFWAFVISLTFFSYLPLSSLSHKTFWWFYSYGFLNFVCLWKIYLALIVFVYAKPTTTSTTKIWFTFYFTWNA